MSGITPLLIRGRFQALAERFEEVHAGLQLRDLDVLVGLVGDPDLARAADDGWNSDLVQDAAFGAK